VQSGIHWDLLSEKLRSWIVTEAAKRPSIADVYDDCLAYLADPKLTRQGLRLAIRRYVPEWGEITAAMPLKRGGRAQGSPAEAAARAVSGRSLMDFVRDSRREGCKICGLPADVRAQLREASSKKITMSQQLQWLATDYGATISAAEMMAHRGGRHEV